MGCQEIVNVTTFIVFLSLVVFCFPYLAAAMFCSHCLFGGLRPPHGYLQRNRHIHHAMSLSWETRLTSPFKDVTLTPRHFTKVPFTISWHPMVFPDSRASFCRLQLCDCGWVWLLCFAWSGLRLKRLVRTWALPAARDAGRASPAPHDYLPVTFIAWWAPCTRETGALKTGKIL